jgi:hypothetical protein
MCSVLAMSSRVLFLLLAAMMATVHFADRASSADVRIVIAGPSGPLYAAPDAAKPHMRPLPRLAQARCPGGRLVFLSRACGCNGACCRCSRETPYLNHCTCQCEANPSPCARGHSAGNP